MKHRKYMYCYLWVDDEVRHPTAGGGIVGSSADELTIKTWYRDGGLRNQILGPLLADVHVLICTNKPWLWY